jgi:N-acetyl-anhydromuramyl-L-alanine amidase AmpD
MVRLPCPSDLRRPTVWWMMGAGVLASVAAVWWLQQSSGDFLPPLPLPHARPAPSPPAQAAWSTPLQRQCHGADAQLSQRLRRLQQTYPDAVVKLQIDPTNYAERLSHDAYGNPLSTRPSLVVLHETVYGLQSALHTFGSANHRDQDQVSYHVLIGEDGRIVEALDPDKRAYGAGYSAFAGEWAVTNAALDGSVNNFALHISLETPLDGEDSAETHSGYSSAQYDALAVVLADWMKRFKIPADRITTHRHVDLGQERADPRSFSWDSLQQRLAALGMLC